MGNHIIKFEYNDGVKLKNPITWCGGEPGNWNFLDAQHALLTVDKQSCIDACEKCLSALIRTTQKGIS